METLQNLPIIAFKSPTAWTKWLNSHHTEPAGLWLKLAKKDSGIPTVTYTEALEEALCYGWIDGQKRTYDHQYFLQKFTPRRAKSMWSQVNVQKIAALIAAGRMQPAGLAAVEAAKADGRWDQAYASPSMITVPPELEAALARNPKAKAAFDALTRTNRYSILWNIHTAKRPETRAARIVKYIQALEEGNQP